jgi:hypothetical protein
MRSLFSGILVIACAIVLAAQESGYRGLAPGRSTRADVERLLGAPTAPPTGSIVEHRSAREGERVFVTLSPSDVVERIVLVYANNVDRAGALTAAGLQAAALTGTVVNERRRLEEFFKGPNVAFTYAGETAASGVNRITFYERGGFDIAAAKAVPVTSPVVKNDQPPRPVERRTTVAAGPPVPVKGDTTDSFAVSDEVGRQLAGAYAVNNSDWLSEIVVTWANGRLEARLPAWSAPLYARYRSRATVAGEPEQDVWTFAANGNDDVMFQFNVSRDSNRPLRASFLDDRTSKSVTANGVKRAR